MSTMTCNAPAVNVRFDSRAIAPAPASFGYRTPTPVEVKRAKAFGLRLPAAPVEPPVVAAAVEISAPAAVEVSAPAATSSPAKLDAAWHSGYGLGVDGIDAAPRKVWAADVQAAFVDGLAWGQQQRDADLEATAELYEAMTSGMMAAYAPAETFRD
jgi:hypothetical protein